MTATTSPNIMQTEPNSPTTLVQCIFAAAIAKRHTSAKPRRRKLTND